MVEVSVNKKKWEKKNKEWKWMMVSEKRGMGIKRRKMIVKRVKEK